MTEGCKLAIFWAFFAAMALFAFAIVAFEL